MGNKKNGPFKKTWKNLRWQWNITIWGHMLMGDTSSNGWFSSVMLFFSGGDLHHSRNRRTHCRLLGGQVLQFVYGRIHYYLMLPFGNQMTLIL